MKMHFWGPPLNTNSMNFHAKNGEPSDHDSQMAWDGMGRDVIAPEAVLALGTLSEKAVALAIVIVFSGLSVGFKCFFYQPSFFFFF